ncbi:hypothetical protein Ddye_027637 [Dipteronia dyeriana]|uniref:No apical meristem-associated C-terminal domain-containing protein n=1 Tax=Dipteronia dyeriana TaxID=168575 RepID=A0AAD9WRM0_9ROSI|nr:hypothetical protein Ddye_027637 [Dipteronia dyeriana]
MSSLDKTLGSEAANERATSSSSKIDSATSAFQGQSQSGNSESSQSTSSTSESFSSSFPVGDIIEDEAISNILVQRVVMLNKAKLKRKTDAAENSILFESIKESNRQALEILEKTYAIRQQRYEIQSRKLDLKENKILLKDLNSISDLNNREFIRRHQLRIMERRVRYKGNN